MQIRCRHNYSSYTLSEENITTSTCIISNAVLIEREIDDVYMPFGGFISCANLLIQEPLKANILNIEAFKLNNNPLGRWVELPRNSKVIGIKLSGKYYALYRDDQLLLA